MRQVSLVWPLRSGFDISIHSTARRKGQMVEEEELRSTVAYCSFYISTWRQWKCKKFVERSDSRKCVVLYLVVIEGGLGVPCKRNNLEALLYAICNSVQAIHSPGHSSNFSFFLQFPMLNRGESQTL